MEPPVTVSRNQGSKIPDEREGERASSKGSALGRADFCSPVAHPLRLPTTHGCYMERAAWSSI